MVGSPDDQKRFRIDVAYDGRPYSGWQSQVSGDTVQDILEAALQSICPAVTSVQGSGRTDAGVSAERQVAHFDTPEVWRMNGGEWQRALNAKLPKTIRILACEAVSSEFHARFEAVEKEYHYRICHGDVLPPLMAGLAWHQRGLSSTGALEHVLKLYEGEHDFRAFSANRGDGFDEERETTRTVFCADLMQSDREMHVLRFRGSGFLYKMVRFLVGTAVYCVNGKISDEEIRRLLDGGENGAKAPFCAPPDGLSLAKVTYPDTYANFDT